MTEMRFLDLKLTPRFYPSGVRLEDRFVIVRKESGWLDNTVCKVTDTEFNTPRLLYVIGNDMDNGRRADAHAQFLDVCKNLDGFPKMINRFVKGSYDHIVATYHGEDMHALLTRSVFHISKKNSLRLAYQLFTAISKMHELGYLHRNIRTNTVRGGFDWQSNFVIQLDNFCYSAPISPPPSSYGMATWSTQSLHVNLGHPYTPIDDFVAGLFVVMESQGIRPFLQSIVNRQDMIAVKMELDEDPEAFIQKDEMGWMVDLYEELKRQREAGLDLNKIWPILESAESNFHPSSQFEWDYVSEGSTLVKMKGEEMNYNGATSDEKKNPITVPH